MNPPVDPHQLELDNNGKIVIRPVAGWTTGTLAAIGVVLRIQYLEQTTGAPEGKSLQVALMPQQCLELAATLKKLADHLLQSPPGKPPN